MRGSRPPHFLAGPRSLDRWPGKTPPPAYLLPPLNAKFPNRCLRRFALRAASRPDHISPGCGRRWGVPRLVRRASEPASNALVSRPLLRKILSEHAWPAMRWRTGGLLQRSAEQIGQTILGLPEISAPRRHCITRAPARRKNRRHGISHPAARAERETAAPSLSHGERAEIRLDSRRTTR